MSQPNDKDFPPAFPPVYPGQSVLIQLKHNPEPGEQTSPVTMPVCDPELCGAPRSEEDPRPWPHDAHQYTICPDCIDSWGEHYYITTGEGPSDHREFREQK
jgi:hypothetical protein